jgi:hypothetical protein
MGIRGWCSFRVGGEVKVEGLVEGLGCVEDIGGSGGIHFRFFAKKHRRFTPCFRDFSPLLDPFLDPYFGGVFKVNFALFLAF